MHRVQGRGAALRSQVTGLQNRQQALATPLQTEQKSIQAAIDALNGKDPDAALQARVRAFQAKQQSAAQELERSSSRSSVTSNMCRSRSPISSAQSTRRSCSGGVPT